MLRLTFMYGYPASGKTTNARRIATTKPGAVYLSADSVREELYGSQDRFGNPEEIYKVLLGRILENLKQGHDVVYDACNLYRSFRADYLNPIRQAGIECYKTVVRMNTVKSTCLTNHAARGRNFDISKISHYFDIGEPPDMSEGWDYITDIPDMRVPGKKFYIASPFFADVERRNAIELCEGLRALGHSVVLPLEHKFPDAWSMPNHEWGKAVYEYDVEAIKSSDFVVCMSYGRQSTAGTNWEAGYAHGIGKPVLVVEMPGVRLMSLMLMNGSAAVFRSTDELLACDFNAPVRAMDLGMEQK